MQVELSSDTETAIYGIWSGLVPLLSRYKWRSPMKQRNQGEADLDRSAPFPPNLITKHQAAEILAISPSTLKKYRLAADSSLIEGVHYVRWNSRTIRYNETLIRDWSINRTNPMAHQQAIEAYLAKVAQAQAKTRKKKRR